MAVALHVAPPRMFLTNVFWCQSQCKNVPCGIAVALTFGVQEQERQNVAREAGPPKHPGHAPHQRGAKRLVPCAEADPFCKGAAGNVAKSVSDDSQCRIVRLCHTYLQQERDRHAAIAIATDHT